MAIQENEESEQKDFNMYSSITPRINENKSINTGEPSVKYKENKARVLMNKFNRSQMIWNKEFIKKQE